MAFRFAKLSSSFILVLILIQILLIAISITFTAVTRQFLVSEEVNKAGVIAKYVKDQLEQSRTAGSSPLSAILVNEGIIRPFLNKERAGLLASTSVLWGELKNNGFTQLQFNMADPPVVFLRDHNPGSFGDDFSTYRPTLMKTILTGTPVSGLEQGRSGYGFRSVAPVLKNGKVFGAIELGADFGQLFLQSMDRTFPGGWGIYNLQRGVRAIDDSNLVADLGPDGFKGNFPNLPLLDDILSKMRLDTFWTQMDPAAETVSVFIPVRNFQGDVAVVIKHLYYAAFYAKLRQMIVTAISIALGGLAFSILIILVLYRQITIPLKKLALENEKIQNFNLDDPLEIRANLFEIQNLIDATQKMKMGLQSFRKYVPAELVRQLIQTHQEARIHGERREITILFTDIEDFTTISENMSPRDLTNQLSVYLDELTKIIMERSGTVDKYIGDGIMAF